MGTARIDDLLKRKQELDIELDQFVDRRSQCSKEAERLALIPEAVRIWGARSNVEREIERLQNGGPHDAPDA
jgi:hypothetical protein